MWDNGENTFSLTNQKDLGDAVVKILAHPEETANKYIYIASVTTTQKEIVESLERQSGQKWSRTYVETNESVKIGRGKAAAGDFAGVFMLVQASAFGKVEGIRANYEVDEELANDVLGLKGTTVDKTVNSVLQTLA